MVTVLILTMSFSIVNAENFGYNNPSLPQLIEDLFGGKPSSFYMPNNKSVFGNFSFDGTCLEGGVEIKNGIICGQELQVFNITSLNITFQELTIIDNLIVDGNVTADNFIGNFTSNSSVWSKAGTDIFLTISGDRVGIGTQTPQNKLNVIGDINISNNSLVDIFSLDFSNGDSIIGNGSISINIGGNQRAIFTSITTNFTGDVNNIDSVDGLSRFSEENRNAGTNAIAAFTATNSFEKSLILGITGGGFSVASPILVANQTFLFSNSGEDMAFGVGSANGFVWRNDLSGEQQYQNTTNVLMQLFSNGNLNITQNLDVQENTSLKGFLFLEKVVEINPGQTNLLRRVDATGLIGTIGPSIVLKNFNDTNTSTSGVNYVWDIGTGNLTIDLHSLLDPIDSSIAVSHYYDDVKGHIWRLNENNNESFFQWESGLDNLLLTINGTGAVSIPGVLTVGSCIGCGGGNSSAWNRSGTDVFLANIGDNVGIGTLAPTQKLDVQGSVIINSSSTSGTVLDVRGDSLDSGRILLAYSNNPDGLPRNIVEIHNDNPASSSTIALRIQQDSSSDILNLFSGATEVFTVLSTGNVGIGTPTPGELLEVSGGNIEIDANFTIGSIDGFILGGSPGFIDFGIKKSGFETRFTGIRIDEIPGGGGNLFGTLRFFTDAEGTDFSTERMTITGLGNVGIGTINPSFKLHVEGNGFFNNSAGNIALTSSDGSIEITRLAGEAFIDWKNDNSEDFDFRIQQTGTNDMNFESSSLSSILFLDGLGNVGIGTAIPNYLLQVEGNVNLNNTLFVNSTTGFVGIGTAIPDSKLFVNGILTVSAGSARIELGDIAVANSEWWILPSTGGNTDLFRIYDESIGLDRLVINADGEVGIGTVDPTSRLQVEGNILVNSTGGEIRLTSTDGSIEISRLAGEPFIDWKNVNSEDFDFRIHQDGVNSMNFQSSSVNSILFLDGLGNVGINTTTPQNTLNVIGDANITGDLIVDNNTLFVDSTNGRVGIGTTTPIGTLDIATGGLRVGNLVGTYTNGLAFVCVFNNGALFASDAPCP